MTGEEAMADDNQCKRTAWTNDEKVELIKLRLQGVTFEEIGRKISRTKHAARSEYGRIRRGETDVTVSLKELPELRKVLPVRKAVMTGAR
jgi:transposase-like protein